MANSEDDGGVPRGAFQMGPKSKGGVPRRPTLKLKFGPRELALAANDVIIALKNNISREEALVVAMAVLVGYGHIYRAKMPRRKHEKIYCFPGGPPRIGLRDWGDPNSTHPFPDAKRRRK